MDWLQNRNVKFAVGCTVLFLLVRWLLTGDLLLAVAAVSEQPAEGETKSFASVWAVVWPIFFEAMVVIGGSVIAFAVGLWDRLADLIWSQPQAKPLTVGDAAQDLLRAVALGDTAAVEAASKAIRREYVPGQVNEAIAAGDFAKAKSLLSELEALQK